MGQDFHLLKRLTKEAFKIKRGWSSSKNIGKRDVRKVFGKGTKGSKTIKNYIHRAS